MKKSRLTFLVLSLFLFSACAESEPRGWPWHGGNLDVDVNRLTVNEFEEIFTEFHPNSMQLRMRPATMVRWFGIPFQEAFAKSLDLTDVMLDRCKAHYMRCVVQLEDFVDPAKGYNYPSPTFWDSATDKQEVLQMVHVMSARFALRGSELGAYQLSPSEPVELLNGFSVDPSGWLAFASAEITTIRANDPGRWLIYSPPVWGLPNADLDSFLQLPFTRLMLGVHMYDPHEYTHQGINQYQVVYDYPGFVLRNQVWDKARLVADLKKLRDFQLAYDVPIYIGEFSALRCAPGANTYLADVIDIFNSYDWSWQYFSLNKEGYHGWNPRYGTAACGNDWQTDFIGTTAPRWLFLKSKFDNL